MIFLKLPNIQYESSNFGGNMFWTSSKISLVQDYLQPGITFKLIVDGTESKAKMPLRPFLQYLTSN